jgi:hypothetical protein
MGEYCAFQIGRYGAGMAAPEWTHFRHQEYDGPRAFAQILRAATNTEIDYQTSPNPPSTWVLFVAWLRIIVVSLRRPAPMRWRRFNEAWQPGPSSPSQPVAIAWSLFSKEETQRMGELARSRGVSLQSWLLWALKEAIVPELVPGTGAVAWHVPVNMHGAFPSDVDRGNSNFSLEVKFPPDAGPLVVHKAIREELRLRRHWVAAKWTFSFAWMLGPWIFRKLVRFAAARPPWQGCFSNSGSVAPEALEDAADVEEWFIGMNPVVKTSPLGACCSEWRGRLALSVQIHPSLATDPQVARDWIGAWGRFAKGEAA